MGRSRVSTSPDVKRIGQGLSYPGIDPRVNCIIAFVNEFNLTDEGPMVDVTLQDGTEDTVRVGSLYAGPGFGIYVPLEEHDEVLVAYPEGAYDNGGIIVARMWSKSDAPPSTATDNKSDLCMVVEKDKKFRVLMKGSGNLILQVEDGKVLLGNESGTKSVARKTDSVDGGTVTATSLPAGGAVTFSYIPSGGGTPIVGPSLKLTGGKITGGSDKVESA